MSNTELQRLAEVRRERFAAQPGSRLFAPLADTLRELGEYEQALTLLEEGLVRYPDFQAALVILGRTLTDAGRLEHGRKVLRKVLDRDPDNTIALDLLAENANAPQPPLESGASFATMTLVEIYLAQGYWDKALSALLQIQLRHPERSDIAEKICELRAIEAGQGAQAAADRQDELCDGGAEDAALSQESRAARRLEEKRSFERWLERIRADESASS